MDYFTSSVSNRLAEGGQAKDLYQRIVEFRRAGPALQDHSGRPSMRPLLSSPSLPPPSVSGDDVLHRSTSSDDSVPPEAPQEPTINTERRYVNMKLY